MHCHICDFDELTNKDEFEYPAGTTVEDDPVTKKPVCTVCRDTVYRVLQISEVDDGGESKENVEGLDVLELDVLET